MALYKFENNTYDIYEGKNYIRSGKISLAPKTRTQVIKTTSEVGFCGVLLYKLNILRGLKHKVDEYKYKNLVYMLVRETYSDSDDNKHTIKRLINIGGYAKAQSESADIKHLSVAFAGQLTSVEIVIVNDSSYTVTLDSLGVYKAMAYSNANIEDDIHIIDRQQHEIIDDEPDLGDFETVLFVPTYPGSYSILKAGNSEDFGLDFWNTNSRWQFGWAVGADANPSWPQNSRFTVWDDKGNLVGNPSMNPCTLPDYSEYFIVSPSNWNDLEEQGLDHSGISTSAFEDISLIFYMNNLQRKYKGNAQKYHKCWKENIVSSYENSEGVVIARHFDSTNGSQVLRKWWDNSKENCKCITFQYIVQPDYIGEDGFVHYYYCSTQPFTAGGHLARPVMSKAGIFWCMFIGSVCDKLGTVDTVLTTKSAYNKMSLLERFKLMIPDAMELSEYTEALEDKYPDGDQQA